MQSFLPIQTVSGLDSSNPLSSSYDDIVIAQEEIEKGELAAIFLPGLRGYQFLSTCCHCHQ